MLNLAPPFFFWVRKSENVYNHSFGPRARQLELVQALQHAERVRPDEPHEVVAPQRPEREERRDLRSPFQVLSLALKRLHSELWYHSKSD
jgi:hypothetical protein